MKRKKSESLSRKEFLLRSTGGIIGAGVAAPTFVRNVSASQDLEYRTLGRTGLKVTSVGFGTVSSDVPNVVKRAVDAGINFIDTGRMYANGKNEEMIGSVIKDMRKSLVIQTKFASKFLDNGKAIEKSIDESLKALQTDYIDIMLIHSISEESHLSSEIAIKAFDKAKQSGKIRFTGFSTHSGASYELLRAGAKAGIYDIAMVPFNHAGHFDHTVYEGFHVDWNQDLLEKEMEKAVEAGMGIVAMKTCSAGPYKGDGDKKASFPSGLKWNLRNKSLSTMAVCMSNIREVVENVKVMAK